MYIFVVNFHLLFFMLPRKHWPLEWELTAELCNTWSGTQSFMVIKEEYERNTEDFLGWAGLFLIGVAEDGKLPQEMPPRTCNGPLSRSEKGGPGQGPPCPWGLCLKFALQSQVILFKYIQEMKKTQPKTNKQKSKKKSKHKKALGYFFIFTKLMKILWCNGGLFSDHNKMEWL